MALLRKENSSVPRWVREPSGVGLNGCPARCAWGGGRRPRLRSPPFGFAHRRSAPGRVPAAATPRSAYGQVPATLAPLPALPGDRQGDALPGALAVVPVVAL